VRTQADVAFSAQSIGSMFGLYFRAAPPASFAEVMQCDKDKFNRFFHAMLERGVYLAPSAYEAGLSRRRTARRRSRDPERGTRGLCFAKVGRA
jgi:glutamate-1-semialdehyde aminotransferase